jgi:Ca2+-binding EF-hand superfamily protein
VSQRPTTASARAGPNSEYRICPSDDSNMEREVVTRPESAFSDIPNDNDVGLSDGEWAGNLADVNLNKESFPVSNSSYRGSYGEGRVVYGEHSDNIGSNCDDGLRSSQCADKDCGVNLDTASASLNGTEHEALSSSTTSRSPAQKDWENLEGTLEIITDADREYKGSRTADHGSFHGDWGGGRSAYRGVSSSSDSQLRTESDRDRDHLLCHHSDDHFERSDEITTEPMGHLRYLASQTLSTVRDMVLQRRSSGKHLGEIFRHFDRTGKLYFDAKDFIKATSDLHIETTEKVAALAVAEIALDGIDSVSYGEFQVFILDPAHRALEGSIQQRLAESLERHGRAFQASFHSVFWEEERDVTGVVSTQDNLTDGSVSVAAFVSSCHKLGLRLSRTDLDRLVRRFDVRGEMRSCAASRFIRMVERSDQWQRAEAALVHQYVAGKEAAALRAEASNPQVTTGD